jgi:hypothetical protein
MRKRLCGRLFAFRVCFCVLNPPYRQHEHGTPYCSACFQNQPFNKAANCKASLRRQLRVYKKGCASIWFWFLGDKKKTHGKEAGQAGNSKLRGSIINLL